MPPLQTTIGNQTLNFIDMITHVGSSVIALPLVAILESIAVSKAFGENAFFYRNSERKLCFENHEFKILSSTLSS